MRVIKKTNNKYLFYQDGNDYILNLGAIKKGEDTSTELLFEDVEDLKKLSVSATCACTVADRNEIDAHTLSVKIKYKNCDSTFSKVLNCVNNKEKFLIRIKGTCTN